MVCAGVLAAAIVVSASCQPFAFTPDDTTFIFWIGDFSNERPLPAGYFESLTPWGAVVRVARAARPIECAQTADSPGNSLTLLCV